MAQKKLQKGSRYEQHDLDGDGIVAVTDVLLFLSDYGCVIPVCLGDINGDDLTTVSDLLLLLSQFAEACEP